MDKLVKTARSMARLLDKLILTARSMARLLDKLVLTARSGGKCGRSFRRNLGAS